MRHGILSPGGDWPKTGWGVDEDEKAKSERSDLRGYFNLSVEIRLRQGDLAVFGKFTYNRQF
jgi:hypothetical protein